MLLCICKLQGIGNVDPGYTETVAPKTPICTCYEVMRFGYSDKLLGVPKKSRIIHDLIAVIFLVLATTWAEQVYHRLLLDCIVSAENIWRNGP